MNQFVVLERSSKAKIFSNDWLKIFSSISIEKFSFCSMSLTKLDVDDTLRTIFRMKVHKELTAIQWPLVLVQRHWTWKLPEGVIMKLCDSIRILKMSQFLMSLCFVQFPNAFELFIWIFDPIWWKTIWSSLNFNFKMIIDWRIFEMICDVPFKKDSLFSSTVQMKERWRHICHLRDSVR